MQARTTHTGTVTESDVKSFVIWRLSKSEPKPVPEILKECQRLWGDDNLGEKAIFSLLENHLVRFSIDPNPDSSEDDPKFNMIELVSPMSFRYTQYLGKKFRAYILETTAKYWNLDESWA
jgi:hypothetical protein